MTNESLYLPNHFEYVIITPDLTIAEISPQAHLFFDNYQVVNPGDPIVLAFPELIGSETMLQAIIQEGKESFEIKGIARATVVDNSPSLKYLDLVCQQLGDGAIVLIENVTETFHLRQAFVQRVNETELLLNALVLSEDYNKKIISSIGDGLFVTSKSGQIKTVNQAALTLFEYQENELIGKPIALIIKDNDFLKRALQQRLDAVEFLKEVEVSCVTKTGSEIVVDFSCSVIATKNKDLPAFVYIGRDITARKQAEAEINKALQKEKELNDLKSRFIAMASHEFRTPLTTIFMSVELLENFFDRWNQEKRETHLHRIKYCAQNMQDLLEDILAIGQAEAGKLELKLAPLDVEKFSSSLVEDFQFTAGKEHPITLNFSQPIPPGMMDEKLVRQILTNLLSNAIKYSPAGGAIAIEVQQKANWVQWIIKDEGVGIPEEDQPRIFESFHRSKNVGGIAGTGLGLTIVKKALDLHGGDINFTSELGKGTTFTVSLPLNLEG